MSFKEVLVYVFIAISVSLLFNLGDISQLSTNEKFAQSSVTVTRPDELAGGSGVIISSSTSESKILTNGHICEDLENGGIVKSDIKTSPVKYYQVSTNHDICLVTVYGDFYVNTAIAKKEPKIYDESILVGHPGLLPTILTYGHFSGKEITDIDVNPFEKKSYQSQVISNMAARGSSGSAVFNNKGEIAGLLFAFAGVGGFGYGLIVPHEFLVNFFQIELSNLPKILPKNKNVNNSKKTIKPSYKSCRAPYPGK